MPEGRGTSDRDKLDFDCRPEGCRRVHHLNKNQKRAEKEKNPQNWNWKDRETAG